MNKEKNKKTNKKATWLFMGFYVMFLMMSLIVGFQPGRQIGENFLFFAWDVIKIFPPAFILVGLFMVWVDRSVIERFFGEASGFLGYIASLLLAFTTLYPFIVVLPMAAALQKKGARLSYVLTYLGASAIVRIPMSIFEASFLGIKFTLIRYVVSLPLVVISAIILEKIVGKTYQIPVVEEEVL